MILRHRTVVSILAALSFSATAMTCDPPVIDPPDLQLDAVHYSNLPRGDYVITNGKGEVLMEAPRLRPGDKKSARIDLDKLDGTIIIEVRNVDRVTYTQTLMHTPGVPVSLEWKEGPATFELTEVPPQKAPGRATEDGGGGGED